MSDQWRHWVMKVTPAEGKWNKIANGTDLVWRLTWGT